MMNGTIVFKYYNPKLNIVLQNWKLVYLLHPDPVMLLPEIYKGNLVYRETGRSKRYSYDRIKKRLTLKTNHNINSGMSGEDTRQEVGVLLNRSA